MTTSKYHVMAQNMWPIFVVHTSVPDDCDALCMPVNMTSEEYMEYLQIMAAFTSLQDRIGFPVPDHG